MSEQEKNPVEEFTERVTYEVKVPKMTDDQIRQFVNDLCEDRIFTDRHLHPRDSNLLSMIFMPLALGLFKDHSKEEIEKLQIGGFWEYYEKAGPRSINGYPIFFSCHIIGQKDLERALAAYKVEMKRRENQVASIELPEAD